MKPTAYSLLAYGSLLHPAELARHGVDPAACTPVRVRGFLRSFCQEPSWRAADSEDRAVLTVRLSTGDWINALRIAGLDARAVAGLDRRERGYARATVPGAAIEVYAPGDAAPPGETVVYVGRAEKYNAAIRPSDAYLQLCLDGAAAWGADFLHDFLRSTWVHDRVPLLDHRPELRGRLRGEAG